MRWLALGSDQSEFVCLPDELLERADRTGRGVEAIWEAARHYSQEHRRRQDRRLMELEPKALGGDAPALEEFNRILRERAERKGTTVELERQRFRERLADKPGIAPKSGDSKVVSVSDRIRKRRSRG